MLKNILGGAMLPHAPQFFTQPDTEDKAAITRVQNVARTIGDRLKALQPDLWIVIANDHAQQFFHQCAPPFTLHVGGEARGAFAGRAFHYKVAGDTGRALIRALYDEGFDPAFSSTAEIDYALGIPMTHLGLSLEQRVLPLYVNAYLPPQPTMQRCYAFGQALARSIALLGARAVVVASGGMSHFPGTDQYANPNLAFDQSVLEPLRSGHLKSLAGYSEKTLDDTGNIELRCWAVAAGAIGDRAPDVVQMDPSWHHNYASLGWWSPPPATLAPHYPPIDPALVPLTAAIHGLAHDPAERKLFIENPTAYLRKHRIDAKHATMLLALDMNAMTTAGVHPLVPFLARMQVERDRTSR
jgi:2,3-dihydroxyphenylpropionate 1,2-dioxygenase